MINSSKRKACKSEGQSRSKPLVPVGLNSWVIGWHFELVFGDHIIPVSGEVVFGVPLGASSDLDFGAIRIGRSEILDDH